MFRPRALRQPSRSPARRSSRIGPEVILAADLNPLYDEYLSHKAAGAPTDQLASDYQELMAQLKQMIDIKILYVDASNTIPAEGLKEFRKLVDDAFDKEQVKVLMDRLHVSTPAELDAVLHQYGTSLDRRREAMFEQTLANQWKKEHSNYEKEIDFDTTLDYYRKHKSEFEFPAQAKWEQLTALFANFNSKDDAWRAICDMGNDVVIRHIPFAEVAKKKSRGPTADKGGFRDWTTKGAPVSKVLDAAIFSPNLRVGDMSQPIEDADGYHIIRVIERIDAGAKSFLERRRESKRRLPKTVRRKWPTSLWKSCNQTQVWSIFDNTAGASPSVASPGQATPPGHNSAYNQSPTGSVR